MINYVNYNEAYFIKLAWGIISNPNALWVRILVAKYCKNGIQNISVQNSANSSPLWKGILKVWEKVVQGTRWAINNGCSVSFFGEIIGLVWSNPYYTM